MKDNRIEIIAKQIINYSIKVQENENVRIVVSNMNAKPLIKELIKEIHQKKANAFVDVLDHELTRIIHSNAKSKYFELMAKYELEKINDADSYILIRAKENSYELSTIPTEKNVEFAKHHKEAQYIRVNKKKWVLLNYPSNSFAQQAKVPTDDFFDYMMDIMSVDYNKMYHAFKPLKSLMEKTDKVKIISPNTNLTFSIKNMNAIICAGELNIPDGEIYTAPIKDSVNGVISYNVDSSQNGTEFKDIQLTFKDGKIISATASQNQEILNSIFDQDEGARYIGEFAIGVNPKVLHPIGDTLLDEKIAGSLHFTPGQAYDDANNGNKSTLHWDLVLIQRDEYGGGEIYFDDILIRKNGIFVLEELKGLNRENL